MSREWSQSVNRDLIMSIGRDRVRQSGFRFQVLAASLVFQRTGFMSYPPGNMIPIGSQVDWARYRIADFAFVREGGGPSITRRVDFGNGQQLPTITTIANDSFNEAFGISLESPQDTTATGFKMRAFCNAGASSQTGFYACTVSIADRQEFPEMLSEAESALAVLPFPASQPAIIVDRGFGPEIQRHQSIQNNFTMYGAEPVFVNTGSVIGYAQVGQLMFFTPTPCSIAAGISATALSPGFFSLFPNSGQFRCPSLQIDLTKIRYTEIPSRITSGVRTIVGSYTSLSRELSCSLFSGLEVSPQFPELTSLKRVNSQTAFTGTGLGLGWSFPVGVEGWIAHPATSFPLDIYKDYFNQVASSRPWIPSCLPGVVNDGGFIEPGLP